MYIYFFCILLFCLYVKFSRQKIVFFFLLKSLIKVDDYEATLAICKKNAYEAIHQGTKRRWR